MSRDPAGEACPDPEALAGLALGEGAAGERRALADHVIGCRRCAADLRLLRELDAEARPRRPAWGGRRVWGAALASAALVLLAVAGLVPRDRGAATRSAGVTTRPADGAVLESPPPVLSWPGQVGARAYRVKLFLGDGEPVWESAPLDSPQVEVPAEARAAFSSGRSGYWTVDVSGAVQRRRLGPFWFEIGPRSP